MTANDWLVVAVSILGVALWVSFLIFVLIDKSWQKSAYYEPDRSNGMMRSIDESMGSVIEAQTAMQLLTQTPDSARAEPKLVRRVFRFDKGEPVIFVVPLLPPKEPDRVAYEKNDIRAAMAVSRLVAKAGLWTVPNLCDSDQIDLPDRRNLILFCSPRRNQLMKALLGDELIRHVLRCDFVRDDREGAEGGNEERWALWFNGERIVSPSYDQAVPRDDMALLARITNPYNRAAKIIFVAGIRSFGTWGAGEFMLTKYDQLLRSTRGEDFALVLKVSFQDDGVSAEMTPYRRIIRRRRDRVAFWKREEAATSLPESDDWKVS